MSYVFISYSHADADYAHNLADKLQSNGFNVWIDARLDYGSQWPHEIQTRLDACDAFILVMSPRSFASEWVQSELQRAKRKLKPIFPLLLEGDEPWLSTESIQYYDVRGDKFPDERFYSALGKTVTVSQDAQTFTSLPKIPAKASAPLQAKPIRKTNRRGWILVTLGGGVVFAGLCAVTLFDIWLLRPDSPLAALETQVVFFTATLSDTGEDSNLIPITNSTQTEQPSPIPSNLPSSPTNTPTPIPDLPPAITSVDLRYSKSGSEIIVYQDIYFNDINGDANFVEYRLVSITNGYFANIKNGGLDNSAAEQKTGAMLTGKWECGEGGYEITLEVFIRDAYGHRSNGVSYTMNCR
jgi:hypothetical protein